MSKLPKMRTSLLDGIYAELVDRSLNTFFGVDINSRGALTLFDGVGLDVATVSPKQLRKFAKALKRLADKVDPPKEKTKYYIGDLNGYFYRQVPGRAHAEFYLNGRWNQGSPFDRYEGLDPVTKKDLPAEARNA